VITSSLNPHNGNNCGGNKWTPTVIVTVTDDQGDPVFDATVSVTWVQHLPSSTITLTASFETKQDGTATFSLHNLQADNSKSDYVSSVDFTIDTVTPNGGVSSTPSPAVSVNIPEEPCL
jgi:hypothetical protein